MKSGVSSGGVVVRASHYNNAWGVLIPLKGYIQFTI